MIDEKILVERLEEEKNDFIENMADGDYLRGNVNFSVVAIEIVKKLAEEHNNGWISVDNRLPTKEESENERLWITDSDGWTYEGYFHTETVRWSDPENGGFINVIAWLLLPPRYEPKK